MSNTEYKELKTALEFFRELFVRKMLPINTVNGDVDFLKRMRSGHKWTKADALRVYNIIKPHKIVLKRLNFNFENVPTVSVQKVPPKKVYRVKKERLIGYDSNAFVVYFPYSRDLLTEIRKIKDSRWNQDKLYWNVPLARNQELKKFGEKFGFKLTEKGRVMLNNITDNFEASYKSEKVELNLPFKLEPYPFQSAGIDYGMKNKGHINADEMGLGKSQPLYSKILTPNGWTTMGNISTGDLVIGKDGKPKEVIDIYEQGKRPVYEVIFTDNSRTRCDIDHLWSVISPLNKSRHKDYSNKTLREIISNPLSHANGNLQNFIPVVEPISFTNKDVFIDPYLLGILIGDGALTDRLMFSSIDLEIISKVGRLLPNDHNINKKSKCDYRIVYKKGIKSPIKKELIRLDLWGKYSYNKHIPNEYLFNSISKRISLLQGLIDTDGYVAKDGTLQYYTASPNLKDNVIELVNSLGGIAKHSIKAGILNGKIHGDCHVLTINLPEKILPCTLKRKVIRLIQTKKYNPARAIKNIKYIGKETCRCIKINSNDHLYVTDDYILTHNTPQGMGVVLALDTFPALIICPKSLRLNWVNEIHKFTHKKAMIVNKQNASKLARFHEMGMADFFVTNFEGARTMFTDYIQEIQITVGKRAGKVNKKVHTFPFGKIFRSVILDEAHECNNRSTLRFKTIKPIMHAAEVPICLTGSPIVKGTKDLAALLELINRLDDFGGYHRFIRQYNRLKSDSFNGSNIPANLKDLNIKLRSLCFIRREKAQVLKELPDKIRQIIQIEIDNREEYDEAKNAFRFWMINNNYDEEKISAAMRAEVLVQIGVLKRLAAKGKLTAFKEFVKDVVSSGEKLVVFCWHKDTARFLYDNFDDVLLITGDVSDDQVEQNKKLFQEDPKYKLIVVTYKRGGVGHTLTAASKVAFIELGWTYKDQSQAEDRCICEGQEIITFNGIKPIEKVEIGDFVYTTNGNYKQVTNKSTKVERKKLKYSFKRFGYYNNLETTEDHKILVYNIKTNCSCYLEANKIDINTHYLIFDTGKAGEGIKNMKIVELSVKFKNNHGVEQSNGRLLKLNINHNINIDSNILEAIGWYVAEGWCVIGNNGDKGSFIAICGNQEKETELVNKYSGILIKAFGLSKFSEYDNDENCHSTYIYSKELAITFKNKFGSGAHNKRIPDEWVNKMSISQIKSLLKGYFLGDGYRRKNTQQASTVSSVLAHQLCVLTGKIGLLPTLRFNKAASCWNFETSLPYLVERTTRIKNIDGKILYPISEITISKFKRGKDRVYDLTVKDEHCFNVGLSNVHNCHRIGQDNAVNCYYFLGVDTVDEGIHDIIIKRAEMEKEATGGSTEIKTSVSKSLVKSILND